MVLQVHDLKLPQAPTGAPALNGAPSFVATEALLPHDPRQGLKGLTLQPPPALLQGDINFDSEAAQCILHLTTSHTSNLRAVCLLICQSGFAPVLSSPTAVTG